MTTRMRLSSAPIELVDENRPKGLLAVLNTGRFDLNEN